MRLKNDTVPGTRDDDQIHAALARPLSDHLHPVLRRPAQRNGQAGARYRAQSRHSTSGINAGREERAREQRAARERGSGDLASREEARPPASSSSRRSARPVTSWRRSAKRWSGPDSRACCTTRRIPTSERSARDAAERGGDPAERLHRQHGHDAECDRERADAAGYRKPRDISGYAKVRDSK